MAEGLGEAAEGRCAPPPANVFVVELVVGVDSAVVGATDPPARSALGKGSRRSQESASWVDWCWQVKQRRKYRTRTLKEEETTVESLSEESGCAGQLLLGVDSGKRF